MGSKTQRLQETRRVYELNGAVTVTIAKVIADKGKFHAGTVVLQELQSDGTVLLTPIGGIDKR